MRTNTVSYGGWSDMFWELLDRWFEVCGHEDLRSDSDGEVVFMEGPLDDWEYHLSRTSDYRYALWGCWTSIESLPARLSSWDGLWNNLSRNSVIERDVVMQSIHLSIPGTKAKFTLKRKPSSPPMSISAIHTSPPPSSLPPYKHLSPSIVKRLIVMKV